MLKPTMVAALMLGLGLSAAAEAQKLAFTAEGWELWGADSRIEDYLAQESLRLRTGRAIRRDVGFRDGTIEVDMAVTPHRAFAYLQFRIQRDGEYEAIWFRTHKSRHPDAIQYSPLFQGASSWQLYHGPDATAAAPLPPSEWIHLKLVLSGRQAALFVGSEHQPRLLVPRLARAPVPGGIALASLLPGGQPQGVYAVSFANLVLRPGLVDFDFPQQAPEEPPSGLVRRWRVSPAFAPAEGAVTELPSGLPRPGEWTEVAAEPSGIVVLLRYVALPNGVRRPATLARIVVRAAEAGTRRFNLGFSDEASVFLNGRLLYSGNNGYSYNFPRRQGLITLDQASLYLPLQAGDNELVVAVSEVFGGWGLIGQFEDARGLEIRAGEDD
jgi:hypothetical protein